MIEIRKLEPQDAPAAIALIKKTIAEMRSRGIDQWDEIYPAPTDIESDIAEGNAFGLFEGSVLAGYETLNEDESPEYDSVQWRHTEGKRLIIHRLCVAPEFQGKGNAKKLLLFAEQHALINGYGLIRLDAFRLNAAALRLYESNRYELCGKVLFRKGEFNCYEKKSRYSNVRIARGR